MTTPEGHVKAAIKAALTRLGAFYHMPVQNGMGSPSLDFIVCLQGRFIAIEAKALGGVLTLRQEITIKEIRAAGGAVIIVTGVDQVPDLEIALSLMNVRP